MSDFVNFYLPLFCNMSKQFLAPGGLSAECDHSVCHVNLLDECFNLNKNMRQFGIAHKINKNMRQFGVAHEI